MNLACVVSLVQSEVLYSSYAYLGFTYKLCAFKINFCMQVIADHNHAPGDQVI